MPSVQEVCSYQSLKTATLAPDFYQAIQHSPGAAVRIFARFTLIDQLQGLSALMLAMDKDLAAAGTLAEQVT